MFALLDSGQTRAWLDVRQAPIADAMKTVAGVTALILPLNAPPRAMDIILHAFDFAAQLKNRFKNACVDVPLQSLLTRIADEIVDLRYGHKLARKRAVCGSLGLNGFQTCR
jgi:hypothetical protein